MILQLVKIHVNGELPSGEKKDVIGLAVTQNESWKDVMAKKVHHKVFSLQASGIFRYRMRAKSIDGVY